MPFLESTLGLSCGQLTLRVAEFLGVVDYDETTGVAVVPADPHNLDMCLRAVNAGLREFVSAYPDWRFLNQNVTLEFEDDGGPNRIANDPHRYRLPYYVNSSALRAWVWDSADTGHAPICVEPEAVVLDNIARGVQTSGQPTMCAFRKLPLDAGVRSGWECIFWPTPTPGERVNTVFRAYPNAMTLMTEYPFPGVEHDGTLHAAAVAMADLERNEKHGFWWEEYQRRLAQSRAIDLRSAVNNLGYYGGRRRVAFNHHTGVTHYNSTEIQSTPY